jgi:hypothetical protein
MNKQISEEEQTAKYLSNWVTYEVLTQEAGESPRVRILGRLEGFMGAGMVVANADLSRVLGEQQFSSQEAVGLGRAQLTGIRKGLDLNYNDETEFWDAHAERLRNIPVILEYKFGREKNEQAG